ncbi:hypothetical protein [Streptomyces parvulus]
MSAADEQKKAREAYQAGRPQRDPKAVDASNARIKNQAQGGGRR